MDKQAQDERWQALTEDGRQARIASYKELLKLQKEEADTYLITIEDLEKLYGTHNLNPEPTVKEWKDVPLRMEKCDVKKGDDYFEIALLRSEFSEKLFNKIIATARISKIIELGYGGMVSEEEWKDEGRDKGFFSIWANSNGEIECTNVYDSIELLAFHTEKQAREFMSHESNKILIRQYYLM